MSVQEQYATYRKKFKTLPSFDVLDREFEISTIENHPKFLLREIRKKITERIDFFAKLLEELLQPDATIANLRESRDFTEKEKKQIFELYKKFMIVMRSSVEYALTGTDKDNVEFIVEVMKSWEKAKTQTLQIVRKMKASWAVDTKFEEER